MNSDKWQIDLSFLLNRLLSSWLALILIGLCALTIYSNIYNNPFVFDDIGHICENKTIRNSSNYFSLGKLLDPRALVDLTFAINYRFGKLNVFGYHLINVLIHIINGFLVYFFVLAILKQRPEFLNSSDLSISESSVFSVRIISLFSALVFVSHPLQTQTVTYTVQRYTSVAAMFYVGSMLLYVYARSVHRGATVKVSNKLHLFGLYGLAIICGILAFLSKQNTASLPVAIFLLEYLFFNGSWHHWKNKLPWIAMVFTCWILFVLLVSGLFSGEFGDRNLLEDFSAFTKETVNVSRWRYICTQFNVLVIYIMLLFIPIRQNIDYMYPFKTGFFDDLTPLAFLFIATVTIFGIWSIKRRSVITFCIFIFFITLSVESSIIPIRDALFEHRLYLPMFGFGLFFTYLLFYFFSKKPSLTIGIFILIILFLGSATYRRNTTWQDTETLWADVVSKSPWNYRAHNNLGNALNMRGRSVEAIEHYSEALRIKPDYVRAHNNLGNALNMQGRSDEAIEHYLEALRIKPDYEKAHYNIGEALDKQERIDEAIAHYMEALRIKPDFTAAYYNLGKAFDKQGRTDDAIAHYMEALRIKPDHEKAHYNLGVSLDKQGRTDEAIAHYMEVLRIKPDYERAHNNLGVAFDRQGRIDEAIAHYVEAIRIKPDYERAHNNLGIALDKQGRTDEAIAHYIEALRIKPDFVDAHNNLGVAFFHKGNVADAIDHFKKALRIKPHHVDANKNLNEVLHIQRKRK